MQDQGGISVVFVLVLALVLVGKEQERAAFVAATCILMIIQSFKSFQ
jgi:hypothetical protein